MLNKIKGEMNRIQNRIASLTTEIAQLTQQGTSSGKEYWRIEEGKKGERKILYILYPMKGGKRRKEYIGTQEYKIKEAQARMERYEQREILVRALQRNEAKLAQAEKALSDVLDILTGKKDQYRLF